MQFGNTKIGGMSFGSTRIGGAKYGNTLVFSPGGGAQPVMIPYIRGGADGSYIDTGITPDNTAKVILWARNWNPTAGFLFGSRVDTLQDIFGIGTHSAQNTGRIRIDYNQGQTFADNQFANLSHYHKYELYQGVLKVDDVVQASATDSTFSNNVNIHLLGINTSGTHANPGLPIDICACQIYKNGSLVRDFTAVNSPSIGLYDAVSDTVFTNAGSGSLTYGEFDKNAYTPLEYIECTGAQHFDSGILGSNSLPFLVKFMTDGSSSWPSLFCTQTSSSSKRYGLSFGNASVPYSRLYFTYNTDNKTYNNSSTINGSAYVSVKNGANFYLYLNNTQVTKQTHTVASFTTEYNICVGAMNNGGMIGSHFEGRIYFLSFGVQRNFVPGKKGSRVGMYDTYNDVFYPSVTDTPFIAGPTI